MHAQFVTRADSLPPWVGRTAPWLHAAARRRVSAVAAIGHLVPRTVLTGRVHSVFQRACNIVAGDGSWLTLCTADVGNGPAVLRLPPGSLRDLRDWFHSGERVEADAQSLRGTRVELRLQSARVWHPDACAVVLPSARIRANLRHAAARLAQQRALQSGVLDREAAPVAAALARACRTLNEEQVQRSAERLLGWGEGLTPAGDDFLVGLSAGLDAWLCGDARRLRLRTTLATCLTAGLSRTTPIAAHYLRLAAAGHYNEPLLRLRETLLCDSDAGAVDAALQRCFAIGATSGADTACGLLAGLRAWLPAPVAAEAQ